MSNLLIDDYPILVLPKLANEIGLNEAIVLQQMHYWLKKVTITTMADVGYTTHFLNGKSTFLLVGNNNQAYCIQFRKTKSTLRR